MNKLKISIYWIVLLLIGCDQVNELTKFNLSYNTSTTISSGMNLNLPVVLQTPDVETNADSEFAVNDTRKDLIQEIKLISLTLKITSPAAQQFDFLKSVKISITADGLPEMEIAVKENIPDEIENELDLDVTDEDIKEYIKMDNFTLKVTTVTDQLITEDVDIDIYSKFGVDAKILGI